MNTTSILIKTNPELKKEAQRTAEEMGISLTSVINRYLKYFIQTKTITFTIDDEIPNLKTATELKLSEDEYKAGKNIVFENKEAVNAYMDKLIENAKH